MNKLEIIAALKNEANISKSEAAKVVQLFFDQMSEAMAKGSRVEIRGLCSFFVKEYKSYTGRNPKTGESVGLAGKYVPHFKPGKELRDRVNAGLEEEREQANAGTSVDPGAPADAGPRAGDHQSREA